MVTLTIFLADCNYLILEGYLIQLMESFLPSHDKRPISLFQSIILRELVIMISYV